jgi:hypothetical protein
MSTFQNNLVKLVFILFAFSPSGINAQPINLVPNPSFEVYDTCPSNWSLPNSPITFAIPWFQPHIPASSTDYFNICDTITSFWGIPQNAAGFQFPRTGQAYSGIILRGGINNNSTYREYLEVELSDSLISGKKYCASFYTVLGEMSNYCTSSIGMYFSSSIILYSNPFFGLISVTPQVANNSLNFLNDTLSWTEVKGEFIASGGERFLTIGNFNDNLNTPYQVTGFGNAPYYYYYIDDVSVYLCDSTVGLNEENISELVLYPNPSRDKLTVEFNTEGYFSIQIIDLMGRTIIANKSIISGTILNLDKLRSGNYFVVISDEKSNLKGTQKLVIK